MLVNGLAPTFAAAAEHGLIDQSAAAELAAASHLWQCLDGYFRMASSGDFDPRIDVLRKCAKSSPKAVG